MRRATPLGQDSPSPASDGEKTDSKPAEAPAVNNPEFARPFSVVRGNAPAAPLRRNSAEHQRRLTPARAVIQPSDPERLRRALDAMREMNKLTRRRTAEMKKLSVLSRELSEQMTTFGSAIRSLRIGPKRKSVGE